MGIYPVITDVCTSMKVKLSCFYFCIVSVAESLSIKQEAGIADYSYLFETSTSYTIKNCKLMEAVAFFVL